MQLSNERFLSSAGELVNEDMFEEWKAVMKNTGKPAMLNEGVKSLMEYKKLLAIKDRLQKYQQRKLSTNTRNRVAVTIESPPNSPPPKLTLSSASSKSVYGMMIAVASESSEAQLAADPTTDGNDTAT